MVFLGDIVSIAENIKTAQFSVIKKLYKFIYEQEGDGRSVRRKLKEFSGFNFRLGSQDLTNKYKYLQDNFSTSDLISFANILHVDYELQQDELIKEICNCLTDLTVLQEKQDEEEDEENDDENDGEKEERSDINNVDCCHSKRVLSTTRKNTTDVEDRSSVYSTDPEVRGTQFSMSFRDIEESVKLFDGSKKYPIEKWISDIEDMAELMKWSDLHCLIFAKKRLDGLAKTFIQSETGVKSWSKLKTLLKEEFCSKLNSATLHKMLAEKQLKIGQSVQEYFLEMKELACRGNIETDALIQYVIDGIPADTNKVILYGASGLDEFKNKLKVFSELREKSSTQREKSYSQRKLPGAESRPSNNFNRRPDFSKPKNSSTHRCFNCGDVGHKSDTCQRKAEGAKCFRCNGFGHKSFECQNNPRNQKKTEVVADQGNAGIRRIDDMKNPVTCNRTYKDVKIDGVQFKAFIDIGSDVHLIRRQALDKINLLNLEGTNTILNGFGGSSLKALGKFSCDVAVDDEHFDCIMFVVPDQVMTDDVLLGNRLLEYADMFISKKDGLVLKRKETPTEENVLNIMRINVDDEHELDIDSSVNHEIKQEVTELIENYQSKATKTTNIEMSIFLTDDTPIFHSPRRLPFKERDIVDQQVINSTYQRSIKTEPFKLMFGVPMKNKEDLRIREIIEDEFLEEFDERREQIRQQAKQQIEKIQNENRKTYNLRRRPSRQYNVNDLVAIKRTQVGPGSKLKPKYLGPYKIVKVKGRNSYDVEKVGFHDGPMRTSSCAEFMKPWNQNPDDEPSFFGMEAPETSDLQDGRVVGTELTPPLARARQARGEVGSAGTKN